MDFQLISSHLHLSPAEFALRFPGKRAEAELLDCYRRAPAKYPTWHGEGLLYTRLALEQSSGEAAARWKADYLGNGKRLIDLTGGLGIDTFAFSQRFAEVWHVERDPAVTDMARHNHRVMGCEGIRYLTGSAEDVLDRLPDADAVYLDPSRRPGGARTLRLSAYEPDPVALVPRLLDRWPEVLLKVSPMTDPAEAARLLPGLDDVVAVSVAGEVKELLLRLRRGRAGAPGYRAVGLRPDGARLFERVAAGPPPARQAPPADAPMAVLVSGTAASDRYILLPDAALRKLGLGADELHAAGAEVMDPTGGVGLAAAAPAGFAGRVLPLRYRLPWKPKEVAKRLKTDGIRAVQVLPKGVPLGEAEVLKTLGLRHGDDAWLVPTRLP